VSKVQVTTVEDAERLAALLACVRDNEPLSKHLPGQHDQQDHAGGSVGTRLNEVGGSGGGGSGDDGNQVAIIRDVEDSISTLSGHERCLVISDSGEILIDKNGSANKVSFTSEEVNKMKGVTLTHNHPNGSSFSPTDILLASSANMREIRAVSSSHIYSMTRKDPSRPWPSISSLKSEIARAGERIYDEADRYDRKVKEYYHGIWEIISRKPGMNLKYTRTSRP
jgi:hypothetical protein